MPGFIRLLMCLLPLTAAAAELPLSKAASVTTSIELARQATGTYYVAGEIKGYGKLNLLVDTGSSYLVINEKILNELKASDAAEFSHDLNGIMANGSNMHVPVYRISALRLGESCWVRDVE